MPLEKITVEGELCDMCGSDKIDEFRLGPLFKCQGLIAHHYCLIFSYAVEQNGTDEEGILGFLPKDIKNGVKKIISNICCYCGERKASVKCSKRCGKIFHFPCGIEHGSLHQFKGRFLSFCHDHKPKQRVPSAVLNQARIEPPLCLICQDEIESVDLSKLIWALCCRHTWYHRYCLQKYALSSGWFFKCVACRDRTKFKRLVQMHGIYVPKQDASWELEPRAFQELYESYTRCDAPRCLCPDGRGFNDDSENWTVIVCSTCGSEGTHVGCNASAEENWECNDCQRVADL